MNKLSNFKQAISLLSVAVALSAPLFSAPAKAAVVRSDETSIGKALKLPVYKWSNSSVQTKDVIFAIHGATLYARRFEWVAQHLAQEGYPVYALDLRGFGRWRTEADKFAHGDPGVHYGMSEDDIVQVLQKIHAENPGKRIICLGESLGANLAVWVGSNHPELTDGLILVSPCVKPYVHLTPMMPVWIVHGFFDHNWHLPLAKPISKYIADDKNVSAEYLSDPGMYHDMSAAEFYKSIKTNTLTLAEKGKMPEKMPVLVIAGQSDQVYKTNAVKPFVATLGSKRKTVSIIPKKGHLLIEHPNISPAILAIIDKWLETSNAEDIAKSDSGSTPQPANLSSAQTVNTKVSGTLVE